MCYPEEFAVPGTPIKTAEQDRIRRKAKWMQWIGWAGSFLISILIFLYRSSSNSTNAPLPVKSPYNDASKSTISIPDKYKPLPYIETPQKMPDFPVIEPIRPARSLTNGTNIVYPIGNGEGKLTVENGNSQDCFVKLMAGEDVRQEKYVKAHSKVTFLRIDPGFYGVEYGIGTDFDGEVFTRDDVYKELDVPLLFEDETIDSYHLTLHTVSGGNARSHSIPKARFKAAKAIQ